MRHDQVKFFFAALLALALGATARAEGLNPEHIAQALERSIQIGGDLSQWQGIPQYAIRLSNTTPASPVTSKGYFSAAWDKAHLYLLGVFEQPKDSVRATLKADAPVWWNDDVMEVYLRPAPFAKVFNDLHFAANPAGERFKAYTAKGEYQTYARLENQRWVLEMAIPLGAGGLPAVQDGAVWGLKVGREYQSISEYPIWPMGGDFNADTNYGLLAFNTAEQTQPALLQRLNPLWSAANSPIRSRLAGLKSFAAYFGNNPQDIAQLGTFGLAIVQPRLSKAQLEQLHKAGTRVIAVLPVGRLDSSDPLVKQVPASWIIGENKNWGATFMDANQLGWQKWLLETHKKYLRAGYDGVYLGGLDSGDLYPQIQPGLVSIVQQLRRAAPDGLLVQNRGFHLLSQTADLLDAVIYENFSSWYNFDSKAYESMSGDPSPVFPYQNRGLVVLCLDYATAEQKDLVARNYARAKQFNFIAYVTTVLLDTLFMP